MPAPCSIEDRLSRLAKIGAPDECWEWTGALTRDGYGSVNVTLRDKKETLAHRMSYRHFVGDIPVDMEIDHMCHNRKCINPTHLRILGRSENARTRIYNPLTHRNGKKTHCIRGHLFDRANTMVEKSPYGTARKCRACRALRLRERPAA